MPLAYLQHMCLVYQVNMISNMLASGMIRQSCLINFKCSVLLRWLEKIQKIHKKLLLNREMCLLLEPKKKKKNHKGDYLVAQIEHQALKCIYVFATKSLSTHDLLYN